MIKRKILQWPSNTGIWGKGHVPFVPRPPDAFAGTSLLRTLQSRPSLEIACGRTTYLHNQRVIYIVHTRIILQFGIILLVHTTYGTYACTYSGIVKRCFISIE